MQRGQRQMTETERREALRLLAIGEDSSLPGWGRMMAMHRQGWVTFRDAPGVGKHRAHRLLWRVTVAGAAKLSEVA